MNEKAALFVCRRRATEGSEDCCQIQMILALVFFAVGVSGVTDGVKVMVVKFDRIFENVTFPAAGALRGGIFGANTLRTQLCFNINGPLSLRKKTISPNY